MAIYLIESIKEGGDKRIGCDRRVGRLVEILWSVGGKL